MIIRIKRQADADSQPRYEEYSYELQGKESVASIIDKLNITLSDPIDYECSCMQKMCGACAMVVNNTPVLACSRFVSDNKEVLTVEPLSKFPVIKDLCVDRSFIQESALKAHMYLEEVAKEVPSEFKNLYDVAKCLKCGLCMEVCPNFGGPEGRFYGAQFANEAYAMHLLNDKNKAAIKAEYEEHFQKGCSKVLACREVCPMKIPTLSSISYMNRSK